MVIQHSPAMNGGTTRAAIYCRVSGAGQEDNSSLDTQEAACRAYAAGRGWSVAGKYREVHSGVDLFERPQLTLLREAMRQKAFDVLLVHALDRLSRRQIHQGLILSEAEHAGVEWDSVTEDIDDSPQGQILRAVIGGMAEMERMKIIERTQRGLRARVAAGKLLPGPRPPYGYRWLQLTVDGKTWEKAALEENPMTAPVVRRIFAEVAAGTSARKVCQRLNDEGIPTPTGKAIWLGATVTKMLKHPVYVGQATAWRWTRERIAGSHIIQRQRDPSDQVVIDGIAPALVSKEVADAARAQLATNKVQATRNNRFPEVALLRSGFARCGYCGNALTVNNGTKGGPAYKCSTTSRDRHGCPHFGIKTATLDQAVWSKVESVLTQPDVVKTEVARLRREDPTQINLDVVVRRLAEVERKQRNLVRRLSDIDDDDVANLIRADLHTLAVERRRLAHERDDLKLQQEGWHTAESNLDSIETWCRNVAVNLRELSYDDKRIALNAMGLQARVWGTDHTPRYEVIMLLGVVDTTRC